MEQQVNELRGLVEKLSPGSQKFAKSLIQQFDRKGALSPKQMPYVQKMIDQATKPAAGRKEVKVGDMSGLLEIFKRAAISLKYPKIRLVVGDALPLVLKVAGPRSRVPGAINITNGGGFREPGSKWYGRISPEGVWTQGGDFDENTEVLGLLEKMSKDPAGTAAEYGRMTGSCCFCNRKLEDERSTDVGYGPVCADHYGLPWG